MISQNAELRSPNINNRGKVPEIAIMQAVVQKLLLNDEVQLVVEAPNPVGHKGDWGERKLPRGSVARAGVDFKKPCRTQSKQSGLTPKTGPPHKFQVHLIIKSSGW